MKNQPYCFVSLVTTNIKRELMDFEEENGKF